MGFAVVRKSYPAGVGVGWDGVQDFCSVGSLSGF